MLGVIMGRGRIFVKALRQWEKCVFLHRQRFPTNSPEIQHDGRIQTSAKRPIIAVSPRRVAGPPRCINTRAAPNPQHEGLSCHRLVARVSQNEG